MVGIDIISERIASMRQRRNMTLKELAEQIGVSESTAHRYETGHSRIMYPKVVALAKALECSPVYLLGLTDDIHFDAHAEESRHKVLIGKYDALDALGRRAVDAVLDVEYERCTAKDADNIPYRPINLYTLPVSAGTGIELLAEEEPEPIYIPLTPTSRAADFVLRVQGDSMEPDYQDGDLILLRQTPDIEEGQLGVFGLDGEGFFKKLGDHTLISLNTDYPAKEIPRGQELIVFGRVLGRTKQIYPND